MKRPLIFLLLVFVLSSFIAAADPIRKPKKRLFAVSVPPLAILSSAYRMSLEVPVAGKLYYHVEFGKYLPRTQFYPYIRGYRVRNELRYYHDLKSYEGTFFGLAWMRKEQQLGVRVMIEDTLANIRYMKIYTLDKTVNSFSCMGGGFFGNKNFYVELAAYAGIRLRQAARKDISQWEQENVVRWYNSTGFDHLHIQPGKNIYPELQGTLKLGFHRFARK